MLEHATETGLERLRRTIRDIPDFPKPGIVFKDITPLLKDRHCFHYAIKELASRTRALQVHHVLGIESRGFIFGSALAYELGAGLLIVRKPGKLPFKTTSVEYALEYGNDNLEMHVDALAKGDRVLIVDDLLATGGTAEATARLVEKAGGTVVGIACLCELAFLKGSEKLKGYNVITLLQL